MATKPIARVKPHSLAVAFFNANGLIDQMDEVREFVCDHQIDFLLVQETFLKPSRRDPKIANFNLIRNDRATALGGTCIYYKRSLHCTPLDPPPLTNMEASICQVSMTGHPSIILASVYLSPKKDFLESDLRALLSLGGTVILAGDLNSKHVDWGCRVSNTRGRQLERLSTRSDSDFSILAPDRATRYPTTDRPTDNHDILDIAILKGIALQVSPLEVLSELASDHCPVLMRLGPPPNVGPPTKTVIDYKKLSEHLKSLESDHLEKIPDKIETLDEANAASLHLTSHIREAISVCSREMPNGFNRRQLPDDARELITIKNAKRRAHEACPTPDNRRELWRAQRMVKARLAEIRDEQWDRRLSELAPSHVAYYKLARALKADPVSATPPLIRTNLPPAFEDIDKAECLADSLEEQCSPSTVSIDRSHVQQVEQDLETLFASPVEGDPLAPTSYDEVNSIIKGLHAKKAPGPDNIGNKTLKMLPGQLINLLVIIFNTLMANCSFPDWWKEAIVIGIHKPGKPRNLPTSYRPISLLNTLAKVYERLILNRLKAVVESEKLLNDEQFGFRAGHSCVHQVHRFTEHVYKGFHRTKRPTPTGALFFDVAKAFDKVWHEGLLHKLFGMGVPDRLVRLLRDFLSNRTFRYRLDGTLSSSRPIRAGVPQGSVLSPLLYSLFASDLPRAPHVHIAQFADDTALFTTDTRFFAIRFRLQRAVDQLGDWFRRWRIEVNPEKSAAVLFDGKRCSRKRPLRERRVITLYGRAIPWRTKAKYLGVTFDSRMDFRDHFKAVHQKASFVLHRLYPMIKSKMSLRHKITLYKTCIRPIFSYACPIFAHRPPTALRRLQVLQNRFMRMATDSPWFVRNVDLHRDLGLDTVAQHFKKLSKSFFDKAVRHPNPLIAQASDYVPDPTAPLDRRRPKHVLVDPDDKITTDNASSQLGIGHHTITDTYTNTPQRLRRRSRGPRYLTSPGRRVALRRGGARTSQVQ